MAVALSAAAGCGEVTLPTVPDPTTALAPSAASPDRANTGQHGRRPIVIQYAVTKNVVDRYKFFAESDDDGTVRGWFRLRELRYDPRHPRRTAVVVHVRGRVVCIESTGNKARLGGIVTRSDFREGIPVGSTFVWSVTDNGANGWSEDDTASPLLGGVDPYGYCANGQPFPEKTVEKGNVVVEDDDIYDGDGAP
jgi:hypothetical protein